MQRACRYIHGHLHEPLSVEVIAAYVYGSPSWLNRQFQCELGTSIMQYVTQKRIEEAKLLLADTDLAIAEIGRMVGYPDPSYFSQVFTRWNKTSPIKYRNQSKLTRSEQR